MRNTFHGKFLIVWDKYYELGEMCAKLIETENHDVRLLCTICEDINLEKKEYNYIPLINNAKIIAFSSRNYLFDEMLELKLGHCVWYMYLCWNLCFEYHVLFAFSSCVDAEAVNMNHLGQLRNRRMYFTVEVHSLTNSSPNGMMKIIAT